jgi:Mrp family chromosome partitioning ATPase
MTATDRAFIKAFAPRPAQEAQHARREVRSTTQQVRSTVQEVVRPTLWTPPSARIEAPIVPLTASTAPVLEPPRREPVPIVKPRFEPALGVAEFQWPDPCDRLLAHSSTGFTQLADRITAAAAEHQGVVAVCGLSRQGGNSTTLLCAARQLARRGTPAVLVDANFEHPTLADSLGTAPELGWHDVLSGKVELAEATIYSDADRLAFLPLTAAERDAESLAMNPRAARTIAELRDHYPLVLVDAGPVLGRTSTQTLLEYTSIDAALLVRDARRSFEEVNLALSTLKKTRTAVVGIAENFTRQIAACDERAA